jgi:AAA domain
MFILHGWVEPTAPSIKAFSTRGMRAVPDRIWDDDPELRAEAEAQRDRYRNSPANGGATWRDLELVRFRDMQPRLDARPLINGLLEREQISLAFGETGSTKTFFVLDIALHIAAGFDWFGRKVEQGATVYVAAEAGRSIINRVAAWRTEHQLDGTDIPFAAITSPLDLCHPASGDLKRLIAVMQAVGLGPISLVVIDTVSRVLAGGLFCARKGAKRLFEPSADGDEDGFPIPIKSGQSFFGHRPRELVRQCGLSMHTMLRKIWMHPVE